VSANWQRLNIILVHARARARTHTHTHTHTHIVIHLKNYFIFCERIKLRIF